MLKYFIFILCFSFACLSSQAVIVEVPIPQLIGRYDSIDNSYLITNYDAGVQFKSINSIKIQITGSVVQPTQYRVRETGETIIGPPYLSTILKPFEGRSGTIIGGFAGFGTHWIALPVTDEQTLLLDNYLYPGGLLDVSLSTDEIRLSTIQPGEYLRGVNPRDIDFYRYHPTDTVGELQFSMFPVGVFDSVTGSLYADVETFPVIDITDARLVVDGIPIPEPSTFLLGSIITIGMLFRRS